jgi:hypothetical protein
MIRAGRRNVRLVAFAGTSSCMEIATLLPPHLDAGGFSHVLLEISGEGDKRRLEIRFVAISRDDDGQAELAGAEDAEPTVLVRDIDSAEFLFRRAAARRESGLARRLALCRKSCPVWCGSASHSPMATGGFGRTWSSPPRAPRAGTARYCAAADPRENRDGPRA